MRGEERRSEERERGGEEEEGGRSLLEHEDKSRAGEGRRRAGRHTAGVGGGREREQTELAHRPTD
eukprot:763782-Hanusia_phi.AAC.1